MKEAKEESKSEVQKTVKEAKTEIRKELKKVNAEELQKKIEEDEWSLNRLEQYGRKWNLRIFGIKDKNEEDAKGAVVEFAEKQLGFKIKRKDIDIANRTGPKKKGNQGK